ncbi:helix-turn-helix domain-containing protein [Catenuloplanes japonicus]|uniref:helix-turn-helix domain-containing protein n=1 Tax=Catenuloplanes japonicus TaxID=33876 RepID=UPI000527D088|nr:helix-turn-helix transcriptional regulator [Catenuloplanes japonicus]
MSGDNALGDFIKGRRGRIGAAQAGLTPIGRRRVPGLRRDELAQLAGVSTNYLIRLEQGIDRNPSGQVLRALAGALHLDADESAHLFALAAPAPGVTATTVSDDVQQLIDSWAQPAYVRNRRLDVLAANKTAMALSPLYTPGRSLVRGMFLDPAARALFPDWAQIAAQTVAALRAEAGPQDPIVTEMLADPAFREMWERHDVRPTRDELKRFDHPVVGPLALRRQSLVVAGAPEQVIITYQAAPGSPDADALGRLL